MLNEHVLDLNRIAREAQSLGLRRSVDFFRNVLQATDIEEVSVGLVGVALSRLVALEANMDGDQVLFPAGPSRGYGALVKCLAEERECTFVAVTCPEYLEDYELGEGLSPQSELYLSVLPRAVSAMRENGLNVSGGRVLVANTEDDMPEVLERLTGGDRNEFVKRCEASADKVRVRLGREDVADVGLLKDFVPGFTQLQYEKEGVIRRLMGADLKFAKKTERISGKRKGKYELILGRQEEDCELTIRYMAQYAVLGDRLREESRANGKLQVMFNYSTPNLDVVNMGSDQPVPIFEVRGRSV